MSHSVTIGDNTYRPTADNPFPFTTRQLARLEIQASRVDTLRLAYRHGQEAFRALHFLPTSEPGLDRDAVTNAPPLSDTATGMLGRLDSAQSKGCAGCGIERRRGWPTGAGMHAAFCPKSRP